MRALENPHDAMEFDDGGELDEGESSEGVGDGEGRMVGGDDVVLLVLVLFTTTRWLDAAGGVGAGEIR